MRLSTRGPPLKESANRWELVSQQQTRILRLDAAKVTRDTFREAIGNVIKDTVRQQSNQLPATGREEYLAACPPSRVICLDGL